MQTKVFCFRNFFPLCLHFSSPCNENAVLTNCKHVVLKVSFSYESKFLKSKGSYGKLNASLKDRKPMIT